MMRQIGNPPELDSQMAEVATAILADRNFSVKDADASTGGKDYLSRILGLIRATGITIAVFSDKTRPTALANIMLELGFAAMCGKPLIILKSKEASAPSDLKRTDWIEFDPDDMPAFERKIGQALDEVQELAQFEELTLEVALEAPSMDCAVAFERVQKAFLLSGKAALVEKADTIRARLSEQDQVKSVDDLNRLNDEINLFTKQARRCCQPL